jgi:hypothetical protein
MYENSYGYPNKRQNRQDRNEKPKSPNSLDDPLQRNTELSMQRLDMLELNTMPWIHLFGFGSVHVPISSC